MADPLSIIGTIITAGTIAVSVTKQVSSLVDAFKSAPTAILTLHKELTVLSNTLDELQSTFARKLDAGVTLENETVQNLLVTLRASGSALRRLEAIIQRKFLVDQGATRQRVWAAIGLSPESLRKARWVFEKDEVLSIRQELGRLTDTLNFHLVFVVYRGVSAVQDETAQISRDTAKIIDIVSNISTKHTPEDTEAVNAAKQYLEEKPELERMVTVNEFTPPVDSVDPNQADELNQSPVPESQGEAMQRSTASIDDQGSASPTEDIPTPAAMSIVDRLEELDVDGDSAQSQNADDWYSLPSTSSAAPEHQLDLDGLVEEPETDGRPLVIVAAKGDVKMASLLIKFGANVNAKGDKETPLRAATIGNHPKVVELLLDHNANANDKGQWGQTPLKTAVLENRTEVAQILATRGADVDEFDLLASTVHHGREKILKILLDAKANPNTPGPYKVLPLEIAANKGHLSMVSMLLECGANASLEGSFGKTPLGAAIEGGNKEVFEAIWATGPKPSADAMKHAIDKDRSDILQMLLEGGADPNAFHILVHAAESGHPKTVSTLLKGGADPNKPGHYGQMPLNIAVLKGDLDAVKLLIAHGVNLKAVSVKDAVAVVIQRKRDDILMALLKAGADITSTGVLQSAIVEGRMPLVKRLLAAGANVNGKDQTGKTPLVAALDAGKMDIAEELLKKGARP